MQAEWKIQFIKKVKQQQKKEVKQTRKFSKREVAALESGPRGVLVWSV
jgi:hypothetical protein